MSQKAARTLKAVTAIAAATALLPAITGCAAATAGASQAPGHAADPSRSTSATRAALPIPKSVLKSLPGGTFYFTAGPNPASYNLWEASNSGQEVQLTHNPGGFGISSFGASASGIVMADASNGLDRLARLTRKGVVFLKDPEGSGPEINPGGQICYTVPPSGKHQPFFELRLRKTFSSPARIIYRRREDIAENSWGPKGSIAILVGGHAPGTVGPKPQLLVLARNGKTKTVITGLGSQLSNAIWGDGSARLAVSGWNGNTEILSPAGSRAPLPSGWQPQTWNPTGTRLMLFRLGRSHRIGLWSPRSPNKISSSGDYSSSFQIGQIAWLAHPAQE